MRETSIKRERDSRSYTFGSGYQLGNFKLGYVQREDRRHDGVTSFSAPELGEDSPFDSVAYEGLDGSLEGNATTRAYRGEGDIGRLNIYGESAQTVVEADDNDESYRMEHNLVGTKVRLTDDLAVTGARETSTASWGEKGVRDSVGFVVEGSESSYGVDVTQTRWKAGAEESTENRADLHYQNYGSETPYQVTAMVRESETEREVGGSFRAQGAGRSEIAVEGSSLEHLPSGITVNKLDLTVVDPAFVERPARFTAGIQTRDDQTQYNLGTEFNISSREVVGVNCSLGDFGHSCDGRYMTEMKREGHLIVDFGYGEHTGGRGNLSFEKRFR